MHKSQTESDNGRIPKCKHICLIYDSDEQLKSCVSDFVITGIRNGEMVRCITSATPPETLRSWLLESGDEFIAAEANGAVHILEAENTYYPNGYFDPWKMLETLLRRDLAAKELGYTGSRICGDMSWALKAIPGAEYLLKYEDMVNSLRYPLSCTGMCQYDTRLFDGVTIFKVMQLHPFVIANGLIVENPFFINQSDRIIG